MNVVDSGSDLVLECDYNADLFDGSTLRRWLSHYETLLRGVVAQPERCLSHDSAAPFGWASGGLLWSVKASSVFELPVACTSGSRSGCDRSGQGGGGV